MSSKSYRNDAEELETVREQLIVAEADRAKLVEALKKLVEAEAEYGDPNSVAVNAAWEPASRLLYSLGEL